MLNKAYYEITNACNLACSFCHGTRRPIRYVTVDEFTRVATETKKLVDYLYLHVMGEPLLHPHLADFLAICEKVGLRAVITTNGTLLDKRRDVLLHAPALYKVSVSLHAYEVNQMGVTLDDYLRSCFSFCRDAAEGGVIAVMRLWNAGGADVLNGAILEKMHWFFPGEWRTCHSGFCLGNRLFLEWGEKFAWPDEDAPYQGNTHACYGLRHQIGILSDGTVVPCCLDADGAIPLGNVYETSIDEILASPRAVRMKTAFENRQVEEKLCQRCGFAAVKRF